MMAPSFDPRADIAVLKAEFKHVRELVERNHQDAQSGGAAIRADMKAIAESIEKLNTDFNERRGAEKAAKWFIGVSSGSIGAGVSAGLWKLASYIAAAPK